MEIYLTWIIEHLLAVVAASITLVLVYHYLIEKETGATVNEFLLASGKEYLKKNSAGFVADISQMPNFIKSIHKI